MAVVNGFFTTFPTAVSSGGNPQSPFDQAVAQKFTCPSTGYQDINKIGAYNTGDGSAGVKTRMWISPDDGGVPSATIVANSLTTEITNSLSGWSSFTYSLKPRLAGGTDYWLVYWGSSAQYSNIIDAAWEDSTTHQGCACTYSAGSSPSPGAWSEYYNNLSLAAEYQAASTPTTTLSPTSPAITDITKKYKISFTISGWTAGTITFSFGGVTSTPFAGNQTVSIYVSPFTTDDIVFTPEATFNGVISNYSKKVITNGNLTVENDITSYDSRGHVNSMADFLRHISEMVEANLILME